jgi:hypothetical protein
MVATSSGHDPVTFPAYASNLMTSPAEKEELKKPHPSLSLLSAET